MTYWIDSHPRADASAGQAVTLREVLFVIILLLTWITVNPFANLADPKLIETGDTSDFLNQIAYTVVGGLALIFFVMSGLQLLRPLLRPVYIAMLAWLAVTVVTSNHPDLSARRFVFTVLVILIAAAFPLLVSGIQRFTDIITWMIVTILILCYAGVMLVPSLSIHQPGDVVEPDLVGDWRGIYAHKNITGPMMVNFVFFGLFIARTRSNVVGWLIAVAATIFLLFCRAKTATLMLPAVLIISTTIMRMRSVVGQAFIVFGLLLFLQLITVGTLFSEPLKSFVMWLMPDATFTGRTEIWQFAIDHFLQRPIFGQGFWAFWRTDEALYSASTIYGASKAEHGHNGFLDLALTTGIPGLALALLWLLVLPFRDLQRCKQVGAHPALTMLFARIWLFGIATSSFESIVFNRAEPLWFDMLVAMFGLRYLSTLRLRA